MDSSSKNLSFEWEGTNASSNQQEWIEIQDNLKQKVVLEDDFKWTISPQGSYLDQVVNVERLQYIGGVDVSFVKEDPSLACGALVVLDASTLNVVHEEFDVVRLKIPYVPGFLAFREAPIILGILDKMKQKAHPFYPQLLLVDGNGILHPKGFGLACHLGVLSNIPAIGIGKNLHHVDGLTQSGVRQFLEAEVNMTKDVIPLVGKSGQTWGAAMRSTPDSLKPIYISPGHRISIDSSVRIVKMCCKFRVPEPIRQADIRSRIFLQKFKGSGNLIIWLHRHFKIVTVSMSDTDTAPTWPDTCPTLLKTCLTIWTCGIRSIVGLNSSRTTPVESRRLVEATGSNQILSPRLPCQSR